MRIKTKQQIEMDFNRAVMQADELISVSETLIDIVGKNDDAFNMLSAGWLGSNAGKFKEKGGRLENEMLNTADDIKKIAENIRKTAGLVYTAEKAAVQLGF